MSLSQELNSTSAHRLSYPSHRPASGFSGKAKDWKRTNQDINQAEDQNQQNSTIS